MHQVVEAFKKTHDCGLLHRDGKPDNILIRREGCIAKLCDYGMALELDPGGRVDKGLGSDMGYGAPESRGEGKVSHPGTSLHSSMFKAIISDRSASSMSLQDRRTAGSVSQAIRT